MEIPIFNSIFNDDKYFNYNTNNLNLAKINNLNLSVPNRKKFKSLDLLKLIPQNDSLFETILITVNDELVQMFLNKKIKYINILNFLLRIINFKKFKKYCNVKPNSIKQILKLRN